MKNVRMMVAFGETKEKFIKLGESQGKYVITANDVQAPKATIILTFFI
jgi:UDP-N-acetylmuramoylalanine--D-glutamate ligase